MDHDKLMRIIHDVFHPSLPRLGPGDGKSTRRALEMLYGKGLEGLGKEFRVLDLGCGNGAQTLHLAAALPGRVTAVDDHQPYLDELERRARAQGLADRIETRCADMSGLDLKGETFDLVWAEGSIFVMGVPQALPAWRSFLKPGGCLGFTELTWLEDGAPDECREFFAAEYPPMAGVADHLGAIADCGYDLVGRFTLPESSWLESFYDAVARRLETYEPPCDDQESLGIVERIHREIGMYRKYSRWYGYVFFLMRTRDR